LVPHVAHKKYHKPILYVKNLNGVFLGYSFYYHPCNINNLTKQSTKAGGAGSDQPVSRQKKPLSEKSSRGLNEER
jgi:hypothetical protein